ncbi:TonB-dependent receptor [Henriciella sp. AS95]|uniref:TonB-dependent receptor n=1 Tax=Henriciella sp. AS95 TaxID=3135782 RepID=UPI00317D2EB6
MLNTPFKTTLLAGAALMAAMPAAAQEDAEARQQVVFVTATPIRDSQQAAIEAKRNADNVVDIISADTIGRFPDQNLADSLGRLPGLAIERDQGQARYINFRGAPFRFTAIAFDGIDVPGAQNGRIPRFDSFPSVITSSVEANKAITPNMPGEAVSGFINVKTFNPFDVDGFSASLEAGYGEQELGGGPINKYNGRISWSNDNFGWVAFGSFNRRVQNTDNREFDLDLDESGDLVVNELDFRSYFVEREDTAYGGRLEFRPDGTALDRLFLSTLYTEFVDQEERNQYVFDFAGGADAISGAVAPGDTGYQPLVLVNRLLEDGRYDNSTWTSTLGADFEAGGWFMEARLNYTETTDNTFLPIPYSRAATVAAGYDLTDVNSPVVNLFEPFTQTPTDINFLDYAVTLALTVDSKLDNEAWKAKLDAEKDMTLFGRDTTVKTGFQFDTRDAAGNGMVQQIEYFPPTFDFDQFTTGVPWYTDFNNSIGATYFRNDALRRAFSEAFDGLDVTVPPDQEIAIEEDIIAAYGMATTEFEWGNFVYGARVEYTDYTSSGPSLDLAYSDDYFNVLPSAHLNLDLTDDLKLRFSGSTGVSRPSYNELRASASVDATSQTVIGGNPKLDPETTWGGDVSLEYYFAPASLLSVGAFYRNVDDVIYADSTKVDGGFYLPTAAGEDWTLVGFVNGKNGHLSGVEASVIAQADDILPEPFDGFGVSGNLTLLDSEFETNSGNTFSLPGTSDTVFNASVFYEKFGLSARVNYQYRDAWLSTTENDSLGEYWDEQSRVDASIRYNLPVEFSNARFTLFANGNNLTDETDVRYIATPATPNQVEGYGRRWLFGIRVDY